MQVLRLAVTSPRGDPIAGLMTVTPVGPRLFDVYIQIARTARP